MKKFNFIGSRIVKTGLSVFFTALLCEWLNWPPVFAVITAIVTIEPTVSDSIRKGIVRFPASAIGSFYAVFFIFLFGDSPITYTAAAVFTILTCVKLKLHDGLLVATLTAVAMVEVIHSNLLISFFIRLGTTSIGLIVSTVVNMFVLPPNYSKSILTNIHSLLKTIGEELEQIIRLLLIDSNDKKNEANIQKSFSTIKKKLDKTDMLVQFQKGELKYHRLSKEEKKLFTREQEQLTKLRLIHYHIGNLINTPLQQISWNKEECQQIMAAVNTLVNAMKHPEQFQLENQRVEVHELMSQFWRSRKENFKEDNQDTFTFFHAETIILYELLSIYHLVEEIVMEDEDTSNREK